MYILIMFQSSKSGVASIWCRQIWDVCGSTFFTCWRSASNWNSIKPFTENSKWNAPPLWVWIGLNYIFSLWNTLEVEFKRKKTEKWLWIPSNWSLKIQNGMSPLWVWIGLNYILASGTPQEWISRGKRLKNDFQGHSPDLQHTKNVLRHTF